MVQKFLIVLFAAVLYNGVTCSPAHVQTSDANLPEEKPPTVSPVAGAQTSEKLVTTSIPKFLNNSVSVPLSKNASEHSTHSTVTPISAVKNTATVNLPPFIGDRNHSKTSETEHEDAVSININQILENKNLSKVIHNENSSQPIITNNATIPKAVPVDKNSSLLPPTPPVTENTTKISPVPTLTTTKTTSKPDTTTFSSTSSSADNVIVEHSKPAPSEEKHFDGPSFIGGIVLTIGLTAIGFIAFKYYKSGKIDRNYRTL